MILHPFTVPICPKRTTISSSVTEGSKFPTYLKNETKNDNTFYNFQRGNKFTYNVLGNASDSPNEMLMVSCKEKVIQFLDKFTKLNTLIIKDGLTIYLQAWPTLASYSYNKGKTRQIVLETVITYDN